MVIPRARCQSSQLIVAGSGTHSRDRGPPWHRRHQSRRRGNHHAFGDLHDIPFGADSDRNGRDDMGLHRPENGTVYYRTSHTPGPADGSIVFGNPGDHIVGAYWWAGDADAMCRPTEARFCFRLDEGSGPAAGEVAFGAPVWAPVAGHGSWWSHPAAGLETLRGRNC